MTIREAMEARHAVRQYTGRTMEPEARAALLEEIEAVNRESGLGIRLVTDEPEAFSGLLARYGKFKGVRDYLVLAGPGGDAGLDEKAGYYGEALVLKATTLGLQSCWVAATFKKGKCKALLEAGEKLVCVVSLGYGENTGVPHKGKPMEALCRVPGAAPDWFKRGMEAAMLAPTALNQQKFLFTLEGDAVRAEAGKGAYTRLDLGIVQYHFEIGAGKEHFHWA